MKYFESDGLWFPADEPSNAVGGTLSCSRDGLQLKLIGKFREGWSPGRDRYPAIHGVVPENPYGTFASLYDCLTKSLSLGSGGVASTTLVISKAMIGEDYIPIDADQFGSVDFTISYLGDWYGRTGLTAEWKTQNDDYSIDLGYRRPPFERVALGDRTLILGYSFSSSQGNHRATISEEAHIVVQPLRGVTPDQIIVGYVKPIQDLLTFATNTANEVESIQFREPFTGDSIESRKAYNWVQNLAFQLESKQDRLSPSDMLFTFSDSLDSGVNVFQSWMNFVGRFDAFCAVYFASIYAEPRFLDERFLRTVSAFRLFGSSLCGVSDRTRRFLAHIGTMLTEYFPPGDQLLMSHVFAEAGYEIEMPLQLLRLLKENELLMGQILKMDLQEFVQTINNTLSFMRGRTPVADQRVFQGPNLFYAMQKIRMLIKILVMRELGFAPDRIAVFLERNSEYMFLKSI